MKKILIILSAFAVFFFSALADGTGSSSITGDVTPIQIEPIPEKTPNKGPRMPARVPVTAFLLGDCITVVCDYECEGDIQVVDNYSGGIVAEDNGELSAGLSLIISAYHPGMMELHIRLTDGKEYIGHF